jgi:hypothetical protein
MILLLLLLLIIIIIIISLLQIWVTIGNWELYRYLERIIIIIQFILCKIWGFHGGDYDDYHLPEDDNHQFILVYFLANIDSNNCTILLKTTEENVPGSEYVNVPANNISSWCTSSRRTIFRWGADIEQCKVSDNPRRNSETNGRAEFQTEVNLSKKESIKAVPPNT